MNRVYRLNDLNIKLRIAGFRPLDVLVIGGTGAGKSSTINLLFEKEIVKIGRQCNPETQNITSLMINDSLRIWDSPGLGDTTLKDREYTKDLVELLHKVYYMNHNYYGLIDMILIIVNGSTKEIGTATSIFKDIVIPNFPLDRVLVAINQADMVMKGRHWNKQYNCPDEILYKKLEENADSVKRRLVEVTKGKIIQPVFYSAENGYNAEKLLDMIIDNMPQEKRIIA